MSNVYSGVVTLSGSCSAALTKYFTLSVRKKEVDNSKKRNIKLGGQQTELLTSKLCYIYVIQSNSHYPSRNSSEKNCYISPGCVSELLWILKHMSVRSGAWYTGMEEMWQQHHRPKLRTTISFLLLSTSRID